MHGIHTYAAVISFVRSICLPIPQSPSWDAQNKRLLSVDINLQRIFVFNPETKQHVTVQLKEMVGAVRAAVAIACQMGRWKRCPPCTHQCSDAGAQETIPACR